MIKKAKVTESYQLALRIAIRRRPELDGVLNRKILILNNN